MGETSDGELVERLRRGERAAFRAFHGRFAAATFRFLVRLAGREAAADLQQEVWLRIARHHVRLQPDSDLAAWTFAIARNVFFSWRRHQSHEPLARTAAEAIPEADVAAYEPGGRDLERALGRVSSTHREILLLVGVEGLSLEQVAEVLSLRPDAVRQRLSRARAALAEELGDERGTRRDAATARQLVSKGKRQGQG